MTERILVVDDDAALRRLVVDALEAEGYTVVIAPNGAVALDCLRREHHRLDMVLLDLTMPVMDGWSVLRTCQHIPRYAGIGFVVFSASLGLQRVPDEFGDMICATFAKPFDLGALLTVINTTTRRTAAPS